MNTSTLPNTILQMDIIEMYHELTEEVYVVMVCDRFCENHPFLWGYFKDLRRAKMLAHNMQTSWRQRGSRDWYPPKIEKRRVSSYRDIVRGPLTPYEQQTLKRIGVTDRRNLYIFEPE